MDQKDHPDRAISIYDIEDLHNTFMLFGNPESPYWFIGLEEGNHPGDGQSIESFVRGLVNKTQLFDEKEISSLRDMCGGGSKYLPNDEKDAVYQRTWGGYVKLLLSLHEARQVSSLTWNIESVKHYQKSHLGELAVPANVPSSCLGELYPMHRKGRGGSKWPYRPLAHEESLSFFKSCSKYRKKWTSVRANLLQQKIVSHRPEFVFCFGTDLKNALSCEESGIENIRKLEGYVDLPVSFGSVGDTLVVFSYHPTAKGIKDEYWRSLGKSLAQLRNTESVLKAA